MVTSVANSGSFALVPGAPTPSVAFSVHSHTTNSHQILSNASPATDARCNWSNKALYEHKLPNSVCMWRTSGTNTSNKSPAGSGSISWQHRHSGSVDRHSSSRDGFTTWGHITQQPGDPVLIPSIQALDSTAVKQDLVQRRLDELHQQAAPQQAGDLSPRLLQHDALTKLSSKAKNKKDKVEVVWP